MGVSPLSVPHLYTAPSSSPPSPYPLVKMVLGGNCPNVTIAQMKMKRSYLERVVTQLVRRSTLLAGGGRATRPPWWPADVVFRHPARRVRDLVPDHTTWPAILWNLIERCAQFYAPARKFGAFDAPRRVLALKQEWNAIPSTPTPTPPASPTPPATPSTPKPVKGKKKVKQQQQEDCAWMPKWRLPKSEQRMRPASPRTLLRPYQHDKRLSSRAIVRLFDIHKEIPSIKDVVPAVTQADFMHGFGLRSTCVAAPTPHPHPKSHHPIRLCTSHAIPFSSDYGRKLIEREHYVIPSEVHVRKLDKLEWYLRGTEAGAASVDRTYECTYETKREHAITYRFPRRQLRQRTGQSMKVALLKTMIKPLHVKVERANLDALLREVKSKSGSCQAGELEVGGRCARHDSLARQPIVVMRRLDTRAKPTIETERFQ